MKKVLRIFRSDLTYIGGIVILILSLNITPLITHVRHSPPDKQFSLIHNNVQDFYFYQALMNKGASGDWLTQDPFTSEPHQPSIIFSYFVWLGKVSKLFGISYAILYHIIRFLAGAFFFFVAYQLIRLLQIPHRRLTFFFFVFATPLMLGDAPFMNWWTGMDPIRRAAYLPHHMIGAVLLLTTLILLIRYTRPIQQSTINNQQLTIAILLTPVIAFIHTPSLFILLLILPATVIIFIIRNLKLEIKNYLGLAGFWVIGLFSLLIMVSQTNRGFPWTQYIEWERTLQFPLERDLPGALGILFPFALMGTIVSLLSKQFEKVLVACWFIVPILFIPLAPKLGISNIRLIQGVPYLPLAILSVIGISAINSIIAQILKYKLKTQSSNVKTTSEISKLKRFKVLSFGFEFYDLRFEIHRLFSISNAIWIITLLIFIRFTYSTLVWSLKDQIREFWTQYSNVYLDKRLFDAFAFVNVTFPKDTITLSTFYTGNYLPVYTPTRSFIGHTGYTANVTQKEPQVSRFFKGEMKEEEAKSLIVDNKITLVFQGPDEKSLYGGILYPTLLLPIYDQPTVTLYKLK